jgi:hypothetical protein
MMNDEVLKLTKWQRSGERYGVAPLESQKLQAEWLKYLINGEKGTRWGKN